ncbi:LOW QUALITY PROTEIN: hypothetical protein RJ639_039093, partial [Escallonia herrerae]
MAPHIYVFARIEAFRRVKSAIMRGGLALISENEAAFGLSQANVAKERRRKEDRRTVNEIFKMLDKNVREKEGLEAMVPPKDKEGLGWLVRREISCELPPFWEERDGGYLNVLTNFMAKARPEPMRGGILADDMELGKTLMLLSLIALDKCGSLESVDVSENGEIHDDIDDCEYLVVSKPSLNRENRVRGLVIRGTNGKLKTVLDRTVKGKYLGGLDGSSDALESRTTLIVCPPAVFSSWNSILDGGKLSMYMYYGERTQDVEELKKYDIVLTTYSTLAAEEQWVGSPMKKIVWRRVILDEAHVIRNANTQQSRAVTSLSAKRRWVVTGTPIQNGSCDLYSLMSFLRFEPFCTRDYWNRLVRRPLIQGTRRVSCGCSRIANLMIYHFDILFAKCQLASHFLDRGVDVVKFMMGVHGVEEVLMGAISLRRSKDNTLIGLPPRTVETCYVDLSVEERELYDQMEGEAKKFVQVYFSADRVMNNLSTLLGIILRLCQICTNVALCPSDLRASIPSSNIEDVSNNPELLKKMVSILQDGEDFDCPICISPPTDIIITCCAHIFCRSCILKTLRRSKPCCPLCHRPLSESDIFSCPPETSNVDNTGSLSSAISSKRIKGSVPRKKSIVFSQFTRMLILLEEPLRAAGFKTLRLDGSMNAKQRAQVIDEFGVPAPDGPTIMLASLKASSTGINLTAASNVYLMEPWWNPAVEQQAMDRVHRIGQKEDVKIVRMIARNSIDERILELQERKKKLAREALGREGLKDQREVNIDDLRSLMF